MYIIPLLFAFTPLINGTWFERFEVFTFAMMGIASFSIVMEGYWDQKLNLIERVVFFIAAILLLCPDNVFNMESYFGIIQNTHIIGFIIFAVSMGLHKMLSREARIYKTIS